MSKTPPYITFANEIQKDIASGKYGTEGGLPGVDELSERSGLSKATVYKSLTELQHRNVIVSRNRTFFVNASSITMTQHVPPARMRLQAQGKTAFVRNIAPVVIVQLPANIADMLKIDRNTPSTFRYRISGEVVDGKEVPERLVKYHYLIPITSDQLKQLNSDPHTDILLELYPVKMKRHDDVSPRLPTQEEAKRLNISESTPVLDLRIVNRDFEGNLLLVQELTLLNTTLSYDYIFDNSPESKS